MRTIVLSALALVAIPYVLYQSRRPDRWLGRVLLWAMNQSHSNLTDWGLGHVQVRTQFAVLDVGCGGGRTIQKMAALAADGMVCGVDYSTGSVAASRGRNAQLVKAGRVDVRQASVSHLPFPDDTFDLATAVETHYYWPDLANDLREIKRVLKPGATLAIIAESYKGSTYDPLQQLVMRLLRSARLTADEHRDLFSAAGFSDVHIFEERTKGWICATGRKPS